MCSNHRLYPAFQTIPWDPQVATVRDRGATRPENRRVPGAPVTRDGRFRAWNW